MRVPISFGARLLALALISPLPARAACSPPAQVLEYTVRWSGTTIGKQRVVFEQAGDRISVSTTSRVSASLLFVTLIELEHQSTEIWANGRLLSFSGRTVDNGRTVEVTVARAENGYLVTRNGEQMRVPMDAISGSLWCADSVARPGPGTFVDLVKGRTGPVTVSPMMPEDIVVRGTTLPTKHVEITGTQEREVWYDAVGKPVRVRFPAKMGPKVSVELD